MKKQLIYAVDDEKSICDLYEASYSMAGFDCRTFLDSSSFYAKLKDEKPDLIILDIMMPGEDGMTILSRLQSNDEYKNIPVILVSAKVNETDKVNGLNSGASDYLAKPFGVLELIARTKANLRKIPSLTPKVGYKNLYIDESHHQIMLNDSMIKLSEKEYQLLSYFIRHANTVLSKNILLNDVWGIDVAIETRTLDMFVSKLRRKLEGSKVNIDTIRGVGYILR